LIADGAQANGVRAFQPPNILASIPGAGGDTMRFPASSDPENDAAFAFSSSRLPQCLR
jgi:hypothetical protein